MYGLARVECEGRQMAALVQGELIVDLSRAIAAIAPGSGFTGSDTLELLQDWDRAIDVLDQVAASAQRGQFQLDSAAVRWLPPVARPEKILCVGANYADHIAEMGSKREQHDLENPYFFLKSPHTLIGSGAQVVLPRAAERVDWEVELAVVVGRKAKHLSREEAMSCIAGYTIFNDISARDRQKRSDCRFEWDWVGGKCCDTFGPLGPVIVPAKFIPDYRALRLNLSVNGVVKQDATADLMIHDIPRQIAFLTQLLTLEPGDIIATGTPSGVGAGRKEFLKDGDELIAVIEGIGQLRNRCVAEAEPADAGVVG
jgi:2,4-diketo-3-deoxy-L-fuconate hydrolase